MSEEHVPGARYCSGLFPLVRFKGKLRHLLFTLEQLASFEEKAGLHNYF